MTSASTASTAPPIAFMDLETQRDRLRLELNAALAQVIDHGQYILGPEVGELEQLLADYCGSAACVSCASGTDALVLPLLAEGIGPGDAVFVPSFTFVATAEAVVLTGATPVFVEVDEASYLIDIPSLESAVMHAREIGLKPRAVIPVDLFGQPADYAAVAAIAEHESLFVISDAAQSFGARQRKRRVGKLAQVTATSFFPSKPLGCFGDGGALFTDDLELATRLRSIRMHGAGTDKYDNARVGMNSRLDTMQAAVLLIKMKVFDQEIEARQKIAEAYAQGLGDYVKAPSVVNENASAWALYTITTPHRERLKAELAEAGIPTRVYYPIPLHLQQAYREHPKSPGGLATTERLAKQVLSLPMHPHLKGAEQDRVVQAVREWASAS